MQALGWLFTLTQTEDDRVSKRGFQLKQKNTSPGFFRLYKSVERQPLFWNQAPFNLSRQMMSSSFSVNKWHWTIDIDWAYIQVAYWISTHTCSTRWNDCLSNIILIRWYISLFRPKGENIVTLTTDRSSCSRWETVMLQRKVGYTHYWKREKPNKIDLIATHLFSSLLYALVH